MAITETFPAYTGTALSRTLTETQFNNAEEYFQGYHQGFVPIVNDWATQANAQAVEVNGYATSASNSADSAAASASIAEGAVNYKGDWVAGYETTGYSLGMSVSYTDGFNYISKIDNNLVEPTSETNTTEWDFIEAVSPAQLALKADIASPTFTGTVTAPIIDTATLTKSSYTQIADASLGTGTHTFDYTDGDMQQLTATGDITITFSNLVVGKVCTMIIDAINWGDFTITLPAGILFNNNTIPTFTSGGTDRIIVIKDKDEVYHMIVNTALGTGA